MCVSACVCECMCLSAGVFACLMHNNYVSVCLLECIMFHTHMSNTACLGLSGCYREVQWDSLMFGVSGLLYYS